MSTGNSLRFHAIHPHGSSLLSALRTSHFAAEESGEGWGEDGGMRYDACLGEVGRGDGACCVIWEVWGWGCCGGAREGREFERLKGRTEEDSRFGG